jgi:hypothetical protein
MSPRRITTALRRFLGLTATPPVRKPRPCTNTRFRPMLESCEDRTVPTAVTIQTLSDLPESGTSGAVRLTRDDTSGVLYVNYTVGGTATSGTDHTLTSGQAMFMPGTPTVDLLIGSYNDGDSEPTETIVVTIATGTGYTVGSPSAATVYLFDNDAQYVYIEKIDDAIENGTAGKLRFSRTGDLSAGLTANIAVNGTATSGTDFTSLGTTVSFSANAATTDVTVTALPDNVVESTDETVEVTVTSGTGYNVGSFSFATANIEDDPPVIGVTATDTSEGSATGGFSFTRSGGKLSAALTITYTIGGTADEEDDYEELSGTVEFEANEDRVEVPVEAFGDNFNDDGETVTAEIDDGGTDYTIDEEATDATVTISDQPLTVSVTALSDGEENAGNATFRFLRSGDLTEELTVTYVVTGTATSGTDFTALSGSVTFDEDEDFVDVTVTVTNDGNAEPTETVTVTLDEDEDFLLGNDSDTVFIRDNDTNRVTWVGGYGVGSQQTDWTIGANWSTSSVPTQYDDVYFNGSTSNINCTNVASGLSNPLYGLHIINSYSGTLTLANALSVGTYEQTAGVLSQPNNALDLTVTKALLWSGGTLGNTDDGADVTADGAAGRIDPPNTGSMSLASTLNVVNSAKVTILPGTLDFTGGSGMYVAGEVKQFTSTNAYLRNQKFGINVTAPQIEVAANGSFDLVKEDADSIGYYKTELPIKSAGGIQIQGGIELTVKGHVDGGNGPSVLVTGGQMWWWTGSNIPTEFGMTVTGGTLSFFLTQETAPTARLVGDFKLEGGSIVFSRLARGTFEIQGTVTWTGGTYAPRVEGLTNGKCDEWVATKTFTVGVGAVLAPQIYDLNSLGAASKWSILRGQKGITGTPPALPAVEAAEAKIEPDSKGMIKWWEVRKK